MLGRTSARPTARYARSVAAAVIAVAALITAANAGPSGAKDHTPDSATPVAAQHASR